MHSFIPDLQINSVSFYVCQKHTVIEASMRKCVLQIHVPICVIVAWTYFLCFKPRFVKYFVMFWLHNLGLRSICLETNDRFSHDFAQYLSMIYR